MSVSVLEHPAERMAQPPAPSVRPRDATAVALLAVLVSAAGAARPSLWFDEAATISAATRPVDGLHRGGRTVSTDDHGLVTAHQSPSSYRRSALNPNP